MAPKRGVEPPKATLFSPKDLPMINADKGAGRSVGSPLSAQGAGSIEFSKLAPSRRHRKVGMSHTITHINPLQKQ